MKTTRYAKLLASPLGPEGSLRDYLRDKLARVLARPSMYAATAESLTTQVLLLLEALDFPGAPDPTDPDMFKVELVENRWLRYARQHELRDERTDRASDDFDKTWEGLREFAAQEYAREPW